jgi:proton-dependent oligopeptide transporter, POT family
MAITPAPRVPPSALRQPPGLFLLFVVEMWERFSYYGMRALLVLYLTTKLSGMEGMDIPPGFNPGRGWTADAASNLYGWYTGMAYLLPILGGWIADRFLGTHRSMITGGLLIASGHLVLALSGVGSLAHSDAGMSLFVGGLVLIIAGTGHFKPCVTVMVGQLYPPGDPRRDSGFSIFYMGINLGAFICAFVCGTLGERVGWHWGFGAAAVGMILGLVIYLIGRPKLLAGIGLPPAGRANSAPLFAGLAVIAAAGVTALFHYGALAALDAKINAFFANQWCVYGFIAAVFALVGRFISIQRPTDRGPVLAIFVFILFNAFFWMASEQAGSSLNLFAQNDTDRVIGTQEVPASWFQSVNPLAIITLAPFFGLAWSWLGRRRRNPSQAVKIALGLLLLAAGYVFMVVAGMLGADGSRVSMAWLLAFYLLCTMGELCLSPTGLSFVTKTAPVRFVSLLMGVWFLSSFVAGVAGGKVAAQVEKIERGELALFWHPWFKLDGKADFFLLFVIICGGAGLVILAISPLMNRLLRGREQ